MARRQGRVPDLRPIATSLANREKFEELRSLDLPVGHYVVTASGPLGIRGIREIDDLDLMVDDELWDELVERYGTSQDGTRIEISQGIEAFRESSFEPDPALPSVREQIDEADLIEGLPFVRLEDVVKLKRAKGREKDRRDIELINAWYAAQRKPPSGD